MRFPREPVDVAADEEVSRSDPVVALAAFQAALEGSGLSLLTEVEVAQGFAASHGLFVDQPTSQTVQRAALLTAWLRVAQGFKVHVYVADRAEAATLAVLWRRVWAELGVSSAVLGDATAVAERRTIFACDVVYGGYENFCTNYLYDHMAETLDEWAISQQAETAIVLDSKRVLLDHGLAVVTLVVGPEDETHARVPVSDRLREYRHLCGFGNTPESEAEEIFALYGVESVASTTSDHEQPGDTEMRRHRALLNKLAEPERTQRNNLYETMHAVLSDDESLAVVMREQFNTAIRGCLESVAADDDRAVGSFRALYGRGPRRMPRRRRSDLGELAVTLAGEMEQALDRRRKEFGRDRMIRHEREMILTVLSRQWELHLRRLEKVYPEMRPLGSTLDAQVVKDYLTVVDILGQRMRADAARDIVGFVFNADPS